MEQDIIIKFCVVGEPSVGKTSMLYQYVHHKFDEKVRPTIGCDFSTRIHSSVDGKPIRLQLWDIAGQERFNSVSKMYLRGALGCIIVCSASDKSTVEATIKWKKTIQQSAEYGSQINVPCLLVQNKSDLINNEQPQAHQSKKYLEQFTKANDFCGFMQCSAKENKNIDQIFQVLLNETIKRGIVKSSISGVTQKGGGKPVTNNIDLQKVHKDTDLNVKKKRKCC